MKSAEEWKVERWEGEDYIITGFGFKHPSVFTRREAVMLVEVLKAATPTIQLDSWKQGMTDAAETVRDSRDYAGEFWLPEAIEAKRDSKTTP